MENTREIFDALILLTNADKFLKELHAKNFYSLLRCVKCPAFGETQLKIDTIAAQLASVDLGAAGPLADPTETIDEASLETPIEETKGQSVK